MDYRVCVVIRHPPYGTVLPAEAYRTIQALQVFERDVTVLFMADGVLTMVDSSDPGPIGMHRLAEAYLDLLAMPGVTLAVHPGSLEERGFTREDLVELPGSRTPYRFVESEEIEDYITGHKTVLCF
jgi:sulfur relay (sulfurtransferase) DsrF/TusC family protein